jgi:Flp pilus assembly pilin Flp
MNQILTQVWNEEDGVLTFEWVLLVTLLTIGIVSGLAAARDGIIDELGDVAQAMMALDQSFRIDLPLDVQVHVDSSGAASDSQFNDALELYVDCARADVPLGQEELADGGSGTVLPP